MFSYVELPVERPDRFAVLGRPVTTDVRSNARPFDGRVYVLVLDDVDISPLRTSIVKKSAREFIERHFGANDLAAVVYTSGRTDATQDFTNDRDLLIAVGRQVRRPPAAVGGHRSARAALPPRVRPARSAGQRSRCRRRHHRHGVADQRAGSRARAACAGGARHAPQPRRVPRRRPGPAKGRAAVQRGPGIADERALQHAHADRRRRGHSRRDHRGGTIERQLLRPRSTRAHRPDDRVHRARGIGCAQRGDGRVRIAERAAGSSERHQAVAEQPAHARRGNRRIRRGQPEHARIGLRAHRRREQPVLRARLLPADLGARRPVPSESRCARNGQGCA